MSLYSDLNEVLTPYAQRIKGLAAADEELKADLDSLEDTLTAVSFTPDVKEALFNAISHVGAWTADESQDYITALRTALYPPANLSRISVVYTQSGTVYDTADLDSLKSDLVVTAHYTDGTSEVVTVYTLSGRLREGTSTILVTHAGKSATFAVAVSADDRYISDGLIMWLDGEKNGTNGAHDATLTTWVDQTVNGWDWTNHGCTVTDNSVVFASSANLKRDTLPDNVKTMEIVWKKTTGGCVLTGFGRSKVGSINMPSTSDLIVFHTTAGTGSDKNTAFEASANEIHTASSVGYLDGVAVSEFSTSSADWQYTYPCIGLYRGVDGIKSQYPFSGEIYCIRLYNRVLTSAEVLQNARVDIARFGIGV